MAIKKGALVKAWDDDISDYVIGTVLTVYPTEHPIAVQLTGENYFLNAIEIPPALAKRLEELGKYDTMSKTDDE